jgi:hypothetical protein
MKIRGWWFLLVHLGLAQVRVGDWHTITSPLHINAMTSFGDTLVCATDGGLLLYNPAGASFDILSNLDGLAVTKINALYKDPHNYLWLTGEGIIQVYDVARHRSLNRFDFDLDTVVGFTVFKGVVYGAYRQGERWGISEFIYANDQYYYRDLYEQPSLNRITGIVTRGDSIYLGTDQGLLAGNPHQTHITRWGNPFPAIHDSIRILEEKNGELAFIAGLRVYSLPAESSTPLPLTIDSTVLQLKALAIRGQQDYLAISDSVIYQFTIDKTDTISTYSGFPLTTLYIDASGETIYGSAMGIVMDDNGLMLKAPDAPAIGDPSTAIVLEDGSLVTASTIGFSLLREGRWQNWVTGYDPAPGDPGPFTIFPLALSLGRSVSVLIEDNTGTLFGAVTGVPYDPASGGIFTIESFTDPLQFNGLNSGSLPPFISGSNDSTFEIQDMVFDAQGYLWAVSINSRSEPLHVYAQNRWKNFSIDQSGHTLSRSVTSLTVDNFGRVWIGAATDDSLNSGLTRNGGLTMLKINHASGDPVDETWVVEDLEFGSGLKTVWDLAVSPQNRLFVLTPAGLIYKDLQISDEQPVRITGPVSANGQLYPYFPNVVFSRGSKVKIDPRGNSWVTSPSDGVRILLSDGEYWPDVNGLTVENSDLLSNRVRDVTFDARKGLAYITTDRGISVVKIPFAEPRKNYRNVSVFPSPFHIPSDRPLVVDGLKDKSSVAIMKLNGEVIRRIGQDSGFIQGYQAFWDGRNDKGKWVNSGVYLIAVYDHRGNVDYEKITVIRH